MKEFLVKSAEKQHRASTVKIVLRFAAHHGKFRAMDCMAVGDLIDQTTKTSAALARALGISRQAVDQWKRVPVEHVLTIEELFGVSRHLQRPDIYPPPKEGANPTNRAAYQPAA